MNKKRAPLTSRHSAFGFVTCALLVVTFLAVTPISSAADAVPSTLCHGYVACSRGTFTTHGYPAHFGTPYWRMYAGNNCTNYVAYVESTTYGVATPPNLLGNAGQWPTTATLDGALVNQTPTVGSVAEWNPGSPGIPFPGHVAIVEQVGPHQSYIVISQQDIFDVDSYDWIRINADSSVNQWQQWPSHFIHFPTGEQISHGGTNPAIVEIMVRDVPNSPGSEKFEFFDGREQLVTSDLITDLTIRGVSADYDIALHRASLNNRYVLSVAVKGSNIRILHQGGPSTASKPKIRITNVSNHEAPGIVTITIRPAPPSPTTTLPVSTSTTSLPNDDVGISMAPTPRQSP
jgi:surface antigen